MTLDALLAPISASLPCGEDLSFSAEFDRITDMRRQDDATLDQGEWITPLKVADWPGVATTCTELLSARTKDLRLAMWLTEALALTKSYEGLAQGLQLCTDLCTRFWSNLHPQADHGDMDERIGNIAWLLQRVTQLADVLPALTNRRGQRFSLRDQSAARQLQSQIERNPEEAASLSAERITLEQFQRALKETPADKLLQNLQHARQCGQLLQQWQDVVDAQLGPDAPGYVQAKEALAQTVHSLERLAKENGALSNHGNQDDSSMNANMDTGLTDTINEPTVGQPSGPLRSRAQALAQLREVAQFFRRTEPHSPVAYLAEKAVKWGDMPLHEWLRHVVKDQGAMSHLQELLGLDDQADAAS